MYLCDNDEGKLCFVHACDDIANLEFNPYPANVEYRVSS